MKKFAIFFILILPQLTFTQSNPPLAKKEIVTDTYFGILVEDPYRYIENLDDDYVKNWLKQQSDYSRSVLDAVPGREELSNMMKEFDKRQSFVIFGLQITENDQYFYQKRKSDEETGKIYFRNSYQGEEILLFDPLEYDKESGLNYAVSYMVPNWDGSMLAIGVSPNGSENAVMMIMDVASKKMYPEKINRAAGGSPSWLADNVSFLFQRMQNDDIHDPNHELDSKTYLHIVNTSPDKDVEIFSRAKYPELGIKPSDFPGAFIMNKDDKYVFGGVFSVESKQTIFYAPIGDLKKPKIDWRPLSKKEDELIWFTVNGDNAVLMTSKNAPKFSLVRIDLRKTGIEKCQSFGS